MSWKIFSEMLKKIKKMFPEVCFRMLEKIKMGCKIYHPDFKKSVLEGIFFYIWNTLSILYFENNY